MYDLMIAGCGPVGAVAANLAGAAGLSTVVIERAEAVFDLPRAIHFDAHVMRILQQAGVAEEVLAETRIWKRSTFYGADGEPIRVHEWAQERSLGWDAHYLFYQPTLEKTLRDRLSRRDNVELRLGVELVDFEQHEDAIAARLLDRTSGRTEHVSASYLLAADGASSFVRTHSGIPLVDLHFDEPWMVIDLLCTRPLGSPDESEMLCDPRRPATRVPGPGSHHRWEFMLLPGETADQIQRPESIEALLSPWVAMGEVQILRASVYRFHALVADRWRDRRVFLTGDAAHQTPVFLGQGLCHGIRDVQNLLWKIAASLDGDQDDDLLDSFEAERRPHVETIISMAVNAGRDICLIDPIAAAERDARTRRDAAAGKLPRTTFQGMPALHGGLFTRSGSGELFPQPKVLTKDGRTGLMDDVTGTAPTVVATPRAALALSTLAATVGAELVTVDADGAGHDITAPIALNRWLTEHGGTAAILRPDHYVHAVTNDMNHAAEALRELCALTTPSAPGKD
jgi:3-(3-hydroxy-phenyl)propionate hydroxylase